MLFYVDAAALWWVQTINRTDVNCIMYLSTGMFWGWLTSLFISLTYVNYGAWSIKFISRKPYANNITDAVHLQHTVTQVQLVDASEVEGKM